MTTTICKNEPSMRIVLTFAHIAGIGDVKNDKTALKINLELAEKIMRLIDEAEQQTDVEIVFASDFKRKIAQLKSKGFGTLSIDNEYNIHCDYYNINIDLPPLAKAILVLHIRHREGLYRKQIADSEIKSELKQIYTILSPTKTPERIESTIENLCDFSKTNYDRQISLLNKLMRQNLGAIAEHYLIKSDRHNESRRLDYENISFSLPEKLKNLK